MEEPRLDSTTPSSLIHSIAAANSTSNGMGNCYLFKSQLQEYAQKARIPTPVYQTLKEGPSHEPVFRSTVIVNDVSYDSLPGFFNRKAAEQSAAEVALTELYKSGKMTENIPTLHKTGLCKNLLQEYAQKMNYAIPSYKLNRKEVEAKAYTCTVEIGGIQYIGGVAKTKKEAEIKAARTALLAIKAAESNAALNGASQYTVLPCKKRKEQESRPEPVEQQPEPKKAKMRKKWNKRKFSKHRGENVENPENEDSHNAENASTEASKDVYENVEPQSHNTSTEASKGDNENEPQTQHELKPSSPMEPNRSNKEHDELTTSDAHD